MSSSGTGPAAAAGNGRPNPAAGSGEREGKRSRITENFGGKVVLPEEEPTFPHLTADLWALVLPSLSFKDAARCMRTNKMFLKDATPRVKEITVMFSNEMKHLKSARRFTGVEKVTIACLLADPGGLRDDEGNYTATFESWSTAFPVDGAVVSRAVPFVSSFPSLKEIRFGYFFEGRVWEEFDDEDWVEAAGEESKALMRSLQLSFCGAHDLALLSPAVTIDGCFPPCHSEETCAYCVRYVECFPPREVFLSKDWWCCMSPTNAYITIAKRVGGKKVLESKEFLLSLIGSQLKCWHFVEVFREIGVVPAKISKEEALEWISKQPKFSNRRAFSRLWHGGSNGHLERLVSLGVPIKMADVEPYMK